MSDIVFECPHCAQSLKVDDSSAGMVGECPECGKELEVPERTLEEETPIETIEVSQPRQQEYPPSHTTPMDSDPQETEESAEVGHTPMTPAQFRELLEEASRSIIPQIEQASAEIRNALD